MGISMVFGCSTDSGYNRSMDIVEFVKSFPIKTFAKGEMLLNINQETDTILIVREGVVKVSSVDELGNERLLWIAGRYDIVPTENLFNAVTTTQYFYTAFSEGSAYEVGKKDLIDASTKDPRILSQLARGLSEHHDDLLSRLNSIEQPNLRTKILFMLHAICIKFSGAEIVHLHDIGLNLTHQDIADMVHATREATSIELKQLSDEGYIDYSRSSFTVFCKKIGDEIKAPA